MHKAIAKREVRHEAAIDLLHLRVWMAFDTCSRTQCLVPAKASPGLAGTSASMGFISCSHFACCYQEC